MPVDVEVESVIGSGLVSSADEIAVKAVHWSLSASQIAGSII